MSSSTEFGTGTLGSGPLGTAPFYNVKTMIDDILSATGHKSPSSEPTKRSAILLFLNNNYQEILMGGDFTWMHSSYDLSLFAPNETGTVSVTNGSNTVTGVGTAFDATATPKGIFRLKSGTQTYRVLSVESATSLTLETMWAEDTEADAEFEIQRAQYQMPSTCDQVEAITLDTAGRRLVELSPNDLRLKQAQNPGTTGSPYHYANARRDIDDDGSYLEFFPAPDHDYNLHLEFTVRILKLEDSEECFPIIPDRYRVVLFHGAMAQFQMLYMNAPLKGAAAQKDFERVLRELHKATFRSSKNIQMKPFQTYRARPVKGTGLQGFKDRYTFGVDD